MGLEVLLIVAALVPLGILLGLYIYITHGANSSQDRRRRRNRKAISTLRQRSRSQRVRGSSGRETVAPGDDDYLDHVDPSDAYFNEEYLDEDTGALSRGLVEDEVDHSHLTEDDEP